MALFDFDFYQSPYKKERFDKDKILTEQLLALTQYHKEHCASYGRMMDASKFQKTKVLHYSDLPFLPVGLFKRLTLSSLTHGQTDYKTVTSSGTAGQLQSQIMLDGETRLLQQQALIAIGNDFIGNKRMPMLIIDCPSTMNKRDHYSARTSGILGFSLFGKNRTFALEEDMSLQAEVIEEFLMQYGNEPFLIFGFTFMVWEYFCLALERQGHKFDMSKGVLVHGGGWKKLWNQRVSKDSFRNRLNKVCKISQIHDYYGMAEQTGSIFMECEYGHLHCSDFSGVLVRRPEDFSLCQQGEKGIIQICSVLPLSYPGHNLLTEDEGMLLGEDTCPCGRKGAFFQVVGRLKNAEIRGCSDTYEGI